MKIRPRKISDYLEICWRRKLTLFLMMLVMLIATFIIVRRIPLLYESRAMIIVTALTLPEGLSQAPSFAAVMQHLTSRGNLATMVRKHKLYPQVKDLDISVGMLQREVKTLVNNRGYYPDGPESVAISFRYYDPAIAQKVMVDLVSNFEQANDTVRQLSTTEVSRLDGKISEVEGRLKQIAPKQNLALLRSQYATQQATESAVARGRRDATESAIDALKDKEFMLQRQIAELKQQVDDQERVVRTKSGGTNNPAMGPLLVRKAELKAQIDEFSKVYTDKHPKMTAARGQLVQLEREIAKVESQGSGDSTTVQTTEMIELKRLKMAQKQAETELEVIQRDRGRKENMLAAIPAYSGKELIAPDPTLGLAADADRSEYDQLMGRLKNFWDKQEALMKLSGIAGSGTPMFQIIDIPNKPQFPVAPNRPMLIMIGLAFSLGFGLFVVFLFELPRMFLLNDEQDIEYYLGAPVIALIPETTTPIERSRNRRLKWTRGMIFLMLAAGLIPALIVVLNRVGIFQILGNR